MWIPGSMWLTGGRCKKHTRSSETGSGERMVMNYQKSGDLGLPFFHGFFKGCVQGTFIAHAQHSFENICKTSNRLICKKVNTSFILDGGGNNKKNLHRTPLNIAPLLYPFLDVRLPRSMEKGVGFISMPEQHSSTVVGYSHEFSCTNYIVLLLAYSIGLLKKIHNNIWSE